VASGTFSLKNLFTLLSVLNISEGSPLLTLRVVGLLCVQRDRRYGDSGSQSTVSVMQ
jgi:hypothetical protein